MLLTLTLTLSLSLSLNSAPAPADTGRAFSRDTRLQVLTYTQRPHHLDEDRRDLWLADDKLRHAGMSFAITAFSFAAMTAVTSSDSRKGAAVGLAATAGIAKEFFDRAHNRPFSARDLAWDALGIVAGYAMIKQTR